MNPDLIWAGITFVLGVVLLLNPLWLPLFDEWKVKREANRLDKITNKDGKWSR